MRRIGTEKERIGSTSISLKQFQNCTAQTYSHWVTLYDSLDDDLFEGIIGYDEDPPLYPRALLEYNYVSSKYTSMINDAERLGRKFDQARVNQDKRLASRSTQKSQKAVRMTNLS